MYVEGSPKFKNIIMNQNEGGSGGAVSNRGYNTRPHYINMVVHNNLGDPENGQGAGIQNEWGASPIITNSTIIGNYGGQMAAGILNFNDCKPVIQNTIIWNNSIGDCDINNVGKADYPSNPSKITYQNSLVQDIDLSLEGGLDATETGFDPVFISSPECAFFSGWVAGLTGSFTLQKSSPCVDAGDDALYLAALEEFDGWKNERTLTPPPFSEASGDFFGWWYAADNTYSSKEILRHGGASIDIGTFETSLHSSVVLEGWRYGQPENDPTVTVNPQDAPVTYYYASDPQQLLPLTSGNTVKPSDAGTYYVLAEISGTVDYETILTEPAQFSISKDSVNAEVILASWLLGAPNTPAVSSNPGNAAVHYYYDTSSAGTFSSQLQPDALGTYWVKAIIDKSQNYYGYETAAIQFIITDSPDLLNFAVTLDNWTYGESPNTPLVSGNLCGGAVSFSYAAYDSNFANCVFTDSVPVNAGTYWVQANAAPCAGFNAASDTTLFVINKATFDFEIMLEGWSSNSAPNTPAVTDNPGNGTVISYYDSSPTGAFTSTIPPTTVGQHWIRVVISETANYLSSAADTTFTITPAPTVRYVSTSGTGDGSSWGNASGDLQEMINQSSTEYHDEVRVAAGTYKPFRSADGWSETNSVYPGVNPDPLDRHNAFVLKSGVKVYGGFSGNETAVEQRDWIANETALSGDLEGDDYGNPVQLSHRDNVFHVVISAGNTAGTVLDGFSIVEGGCYEHPHDVYQQMTVNGKEIRDDAGAGLYALESDASVSHLYIYNNGAVFGAGVYCMDSPNFKGSDLILYGNFAGDGGGMRVNSSPQFRNMIIAENQAGTGGGISNIDSEARYTNVLVHSNVGNVYNGCGGGMLNLNSSPLLTNVSILGNGYGLSPGLYNLNSSHPIVNNSIIWNNIEVLAYGNNPWEPRVSNVYSDTTSTVTYNYSLLEGEDLTATGGLDASAAGFDPLFISAPTHRDWGRGTFTLQLGSPCIDAGSNDLYIAAITDFQSWSEERSLTPPPYGHLLDVYYSDQYSGQEASRLGGSTIDIGAFEATFVSQVQLQGWTYGEAPNQPSITHNPENGAVSYFYAPASQTATDAVQPSDAGVYRVQAQIAPTAHYESVRTALAQFTIDKATFDATLLLDGWVEGYANEPAVSENPGNGAVSYFYDISENGAFTSAYKPETQGQYWVKATIEETTNYAAYTTASVAFVISASPVLNPTVSVNGWTYGEPASTPNVSGNYGGGAVSYAYAAAPDGTYSAAVPTEAGAYWIKAQIASQSGFDAATTAPTPFTIAKASFTTTVSLSNWASGDTPSVPTVSDNISGGSVTCYYDESEDGDFSSTAQPTAIGQYWIKAIIAETANYQTSATAPTTFAINPCPTVHYVVMNATGDGSSWASASGDLQQMINESSTAYNDEIWVAAGTYRPTHSSDGWTEAAPTGVNATPSDLNNAFVLKSGIKVYGGFSGNETSVGQRDWEANQTILSGDFNSDDGGNFVSNTGLFYDNARHVVVSVNTAVGAVLDGFTVTGGNSYFPSGVTVSVNGTSVPDNCGGGIYIRNSEATVNNCVFWRNSAINGGGLYCTASSNFRMNGSSMVENFADKGAGMMVSDSPVFTNIVVRGNWAAQGGGMANVASGTGSATSPSYFNALIVENDASHNWLGFPLKYGSAILNESASPLLVNATVACNYWGYNPVYNENSHPQIYNSIFWGNKDNDLSMNNFIMDDENSSSTVDYCLLEGMQYLGNNINIGPNNMNASADFVWPMESEWWYYFWGWPRPRHYDYHINAGSPVIDAGNSSLYESARGAGFLGWSAEIDLATTPRLGGSQIDLGAYETAFAPVSHSSAMLRASSSTSTNADSGITGLQPAGELSGNFQTMPNPVTAGQIVRIILPAGELDAAQDEIVDIYNLTGHVVQQWTVPAGKHRLETVVTLPVGNYIVKWKGYVTKLIVK
jgi:hypothetical protein